MTKNGKKPINILAVFVCECDMTVIDEIKMVLPPPLALELDGVLGARGGSSALSEIRLRRHSPSSIVLSGENLRLEYRMKESEWQRAVNLVLAGSMYAHRDTIESGFVGMPSGIRVGIAADVRYEGGSFAGGGRILSMVFRLPTALSERADELYSVFMKMKEGMLI